MDQHRPHVHNELVVEFKGIPPCLLASLFKLHVQFLLFFWGQRLRDEGIEHVVFLVNVVPKE
jgi:hypothetical protein